MDQNIKLVRIYQGWKNSIFKTPLIEKLAKGRAKICSRCLKSELSIFNIFNGKREVQKKGMICGECKCPLYMKTRSPHDKCPLDKW